MENIKNIVSNIDKDIYTIANIPEEKVAVVFAYVSRSDRSFRENLSIANELKTKEFHEKYILQYGHSSVAEHACVHIGIENVSRLFTLELQLSDKFLSFTEYSQRYQIPKRGAWYPVDDDFNHHIFDLYEKALKVSSKEEARHLLPLNMHTSLGMTCNALSLARSLSKLQRSKYQECIDRAKDIENEIKKDLPTLYKMREEVEIEAALNYANTEEYVNILGVYNNQFETIYTLGIYMTEACFHQFIRHRAFKIKYTDPNVNRIKPIETYIENYKGIEGLIEEALDISRESNKKEASEYKVLNLNCRYVICQVDQKGLDHFLKLRTRENAQYEIRNIAKRIASIVN